MTATSQTSPGPRRPPWPIAVTAVGAAVLGMGVAAQTVGGGGSAATTPDATASAATPATATPATAAEGETAEAQEAEPPARRLVFTISQSVDLDRNAGLSAGGGRWRLGGTTELSLQAFVETPVSTLTFGLNGDLRTRYSLANQKGSVQFNGPLASFGYQRAVPSSSLTLRASYRSREIDGFSSLDEIDFFNLPPDFVLPDDLNDLVGTGTRTAINASARLTLRDDRPLGFILDASVADVAYSGVIVPGLVDNTLVTVGGTVRAQFNPVTEGTARVAYVSRTVGTAAAEERIDTSFGLSLDRPLGAITANLSFEQTTDGQRPTFTIGRRLEQARYRLDGRVGVTTDANDDIVPTATLSYTRDLPAGEIGATLRTGIGTDSAGFERTVTSLTARYRRELTPTTGLSLVALYDQRSATALSPGSKLAEIGVSVSRELTPDWSLEASYRHRFRDADDLSELAQGDSFGLSIGRSFTIGF